MSSQVWGGAAQAAARRLRRAVMMETDEFVVKNLDDQITAFKGTATTMQKLVEAMGSEEREQVAEASTVLRKMRAVQGHGAVPLDILGMPSQRDGSTA